MADKKYNWKQIEKDYWNNKYPTLKALAEAHGVEYGYLRKRAGNWKKQKNAKEIADKAIKLEIDEMTNGTGYGELRAPDDKRKAMMQLLDKSWVIANMMLSNPDNFFTHDGTPKTKQFNDAMTSVEKIGKGYLDFVQDEEKATNILAYTDMLKEVRSKIKEEDLLEE